MGRIRSAARNTAPKNNLSFTQKVEPGSSFPGSTKKLYQGNHWCFGLGMNIMKPRERKKNKLTDLIWRTGHLKSADFSTYKFQLLIVWLSDCPKIWFLIIFLKVKTTSSTGSKKIDHFFTVKRVYTCQFFQNYQFWS